MSIKSFYKYKDMVDDEIEDMIEESNFDENLYIKKNYRNQKNSYNFRSKKNQKNS